MNSLTKAYRFNFCIALFSLVSAHLFAQRDSIYASKGKLYINIGIGYSHSFILASPLIGAFSPIAQHFDYEEYVSHITPLLGGTIDYNILNKLSLGAAYSYQSEIIDKAGNDNHISRSNFATRILYSLSKKPSGLYIGIRSGLSYYTDYIPGATPVTQYYLSNKPLSFFSFQALIGGRCFISPNFGFQIEIGIGSPYLAEAGLIFVLD